MSDRVLSEEEISDLQWLCERLRSIDYFNPITADMQRLHSIVASIAADGVITKEELLGLSAWLAGHDHLKRCWPYDEIDSLLTFILADGKVDKDEQNLLLAFFSEFLPADGKSVVRHSDVAEIPKLQGLCAACPQITFKDGLFCFTGTSCKCSRGQFIQLVTGLGGKVTNSVGPSLDYLVVGAGGNPCWAYACYGRKIEKAVELRKKGCRLLLVHENDFHDAVLDVPQ